MLMPSFDPAPPKPLMTRPRAGQRNSAELGEDGSAPVASGSFAEAAGLAGSAWAGLADATAAALIGSGAFAGFCAWATCGAGCATGVALAMLRPVGAFESGPFRAGTEWAAAVEALATGFLPSTSR